MQFQLTVEKVHETAPGNDFRMRIVEHRSTDAHMLAIHTLRSRGNGYNFSRFDVLFFNHDDARQYLTTIVIIDANGDIVELFQNQSRKNTISHVVNHQCMLTVT